MAVGSGQRPAVAKLRTTSFAVLGAIAVSRDETATYLRWLTGSHARTELARLEQAGLVREHELTDLGRTALQRWLRAVPPAANVPAHRDEGLVRLLFADLLVMRERLALARRVGALSLAIAKQLGEAAVSARDVAMETGAHYPWIALRLGVDAHLHRAWWLEEITRELASDGDDGALTRDMSRKSQLRSGDPVVLGWIAMGRRAGLEVSGYVLRELAAQHSALVWPMSLSHVYDDLARLRELGLLGVTEETRRRLYAPTDAGSAALGAWLLDDVPHETQVRDDAMLRLAFADLLEPAEQIALLALLRSRARSAADRHYDHIAPRGNWRYPARLRWISADAQLYVDRWLGDVQDSIMRSGTATPPSGPYPFLRSLPQGSGETADYLGEAMSYADAMTRISQIESQISALSSGSMPTSQISTPTAAAASTASSPSSFANVLAQSQPVTGSTSITSPLLTSSQQTFASRLASDTGLDPKVVTAWLLAEESGSAAASRQSANNNDWLNIGYTDSGTYGSTDSVWGDPSTAADATAGWLKGQQTIPNYGTASSGVQAILQTAGQPAQTQIAALQHSGWASSGYPSLPSLYQQVSA